MWPALSRRSERKNLGKGGGSCGESEDAQRGLEEDEGAEKGMTVQMVRRESAGAQTKARRTALRQTKGGAAPVPLVAPAAVPVAASETPPGTSEPGTFAPKYTCRACGVHFPNWSQCLSHVRNVEKYKDPGLHELTTTPLGRRKLQTECKYTEEEACLPPSPAEPRHRGSSAASVASSTPTLSSAATTPTTTPGSTPASTPKNRVAGFGGPTFGSFVQASKSAVATNPPGFAFAATASAVPHRALHSTSGAGLPSPHHTAFGSTGGLPSPRVPVGLPSLGAPDSRSAGTGVDRDGLAAAAGRGTPSPSRFYLPFGSSKAQQQQGQGGPTTTGLHHHHHHHHHHLHLHHEGDHVSLSSFSSVSISPESTPHSSPLVSPRKVFSAVATTPTSLQQAAANAQAALPGPKSLGGISALPGGQRTAPSSHATAGSGQGFPHAGLGATLGPTAPLSVVAPAQGIKASLGHTSAAFAVKRAHLEDVSGVPALGRLPDGAAVQICAFLELRECANLSRAMRRTW